MFCVLSPKTWSKIAPQEYVINIMNEFNLSIDNLDRNFPVSFAFAGAKHLIVFLKEKSSLKEMSYDFERMKTLMKKEKLVTIDGLVKSSI